MHFFRALRVKISLLTLIMVGVIFSVVYFNDPNLSVNRFLYNRIKPKESKELSSERFEEKLEEGIPEWIKKRVHKELSLFKERGIASEDLTLEYNNLPKSAETLALASFTIRNGEVFAKSSIPENLRFYAIKESLEQLCMLKDIPDVELIFSLHDFLDLKNEDIQNLPVPVFVFAKSKTDSGAILYPHFSFFTKKQANYCWLTHVFPRVESALSKWSWEKKKEVIFWRGATTGIQFADEDWRHYPRPKLCLLSKNKPKEIDAKFTYIGQTTPEIKKEIIQTLPCGDFVSPERHLAYKYLLCLDGNTCTSPGLYWRLLSDSATFKQETDQIEHFYETLVPYVHYIPVKEDLSDLRDKLKWAKAHDDKVQRISENATQFVYDHLTLEMTYLYLYHLLMEYAKLQHTPQVL